MTWVHVRFRHGHYELLCYAEVGRQARVVNVDVRLVLARNQANSLGCNGAERGYERTTRDEKVFFMVADPLCPVGEEGGSAPSSSGGEVWNQDEG